MLEKVILTLSILISLAVISVAFSMNNDEPLPFNSTASVVREENGIQYIRIFAQGGYTPNQITAKANIPTVLEVETKGTYDCSAALSIPQLNYRQFLPATGVTKIEVPSHLALNTLDVLCSMGMFSSVIHFSS